jgi:hypothetical protein
LQYLPGIGALATTPVSQNPCFGGQIVICFAALAATVLAASVTQIKPLPSNSVMARMAFLR